MKHHVVRGRSGVPDEPICAASKQDDAIDRNNKFVRLPFPLFSCSCTAPSRRARTRRQFPGIESRTSTCCKHWAVLNIPLTLSGPNGCTARVKLGFVRWGEIKRYATVPHYELTCCMAPPERREHIPTFSDSNTSHFSPITRRQASVSFSQSYKSR